MFFKTDVVPKKLKLDDVPITNSVARVKINILNTLNSKDIGKLKGVLKSRGASKARIDIGFIANPKLSPKLIIDFRFNVATKKAPDIMTPYKRPSGATTKSQRRSCRL